MRAIEEGGRRRSARGRGDGAAVSEERVGPGGVRPARGRPESAGCGLVSTPCGSGFKAGTGTTVTVTVVDIPHGRVDELDSFREAAVGVWGRTPAL